METEEQNNDAQEQEAPEAPPEEAPAEDVPAPAAEAPAEAGDDTEPEVLSAKDVRRRVRQRRTEPHRPSDPAARAERRRKQAASRRAWRQRSREKRRAARAQAPPAPDLTPSADQAQGKPRVRQGVVVSAKPDKTIAVRIDVTRRHRFYKKIVRESSTLHAHDERNEAHEGDTVRVIESRPISRTKRWRLVEILERAR
jgi:small subunit ribosomal protein S17